MKPTIDVLLKILLSVLLFICLADMSYGYFQLVRFISLAFFVFLAYKANEQGQKAEFIIYVCLAVLFQPLIKIGLGRVVWNIVDVVVGLGLIISIFIRPRDSPR